MKEVKKQILECQRCNLHKNIKNKVIGKGSLNPEVLIVSEAPGAQEDELGIPFVGRSGKLLDKWINFLNIRDKVSVINTIKCRPPKNRDPTRDELDACRIWLDKQIKLLNPKYIIAVGKVAMFEITNVKDSILKWEGQYIKTDNRKVFIMAHPAYHLRRGGKDWQIPLTQIKKEINKKEIPDKIKPLVETPFIEVKKAEEQPYTPLHCHTEYSVMDGAGRLKDFVQHAKDKGFKALALTDHGTIAGWIEFQKECNRVGIKPILGIELYVASHYEDKSRKRYHLVLLAKDRTGIESIFKIDTIAQDKGYHWKPRVTLDDVITNKEGLVVLSACTLGVIAQRILDGEVNEGWEIARRLKREFGEDFYIEVQPHDFSHQISVNPMLTKISEDLGVEPVITTDAHYKSLGEKELHNAIRAIEFGSKMGEKSLTGDTYCLLDIKELDEAIRKINLIENFYQKALANTNTIADKCNVQLESYGTIVPDFQVPKQFSNMTHDEYLEYLCREGAVKLGIDLSKKEYKDRLEEELSVIKEGGIATYFLITENIIFEAKKMDIMRGPGRGSSSGSLVCYLIGITMIDPLRFDLLFERFLNPTRAKMGMFPDIDMDFQKSRRKELMGYIKRKYGEDSVAGIPTLSRSGVKSAIRDLARIESIPIAEVNRVTKKIPDGLPLDLAMKIPEVKEFCGKYSRLNRLLPQLTGSIRHRGTHAAGLVITPDPVINYLAFEKIKGELKVCFDKDIVEEIGLLKWDILGLKTLDVVNDAIRFIKQEHNVDIVLPMDLNDPKVYNLFNSGKLLGVFQFETANLTSFAKRVNIDSFKLLYDTTSISRPGPAHSGDADIYIQRRHDPNKIKYAHPMLESVLKDTYGVLVYQEQIIETVKKLAGISPSDAQRIQKLVAKSKGVEELDKYKKQFIEGSRRNDVDVKIAESIWSSIRESGAYLFNESHAVAYSVLSYWCAWLKVYYPKEFLTALMRWEEGEVLSRAVEELRDLDVEVLTPDINISQDRTIIDEKGRVVFGVGDIEQVGPKAVEDILENQPYKSFEDFMNKRNPSVTNIRVIRNLILAGAFDQFKRRDELYYLADLEEEKHTWDDREMWLRQTGVLSMPPETPLIDFYDDPFEVELTSIDRIDWTDIQDEIYIKGIISKLNPKTGYTIFNITGEGGIVNVLASEEVMERFSTVFDSGVGTPILLKAHMVRGRERLYADIILPFKGYEKYQKEINYVSGDSEKRLIHLKEASRNNIGLVVSSNYFTSKNGNRGTRILFNDGEKIMNFEKEIDDILAGDIMEYRITNSPFCKILRKY